jgi:hypothetical protein
MRKAQVVDEGAAHLDSPVAEARVCQCRAGFLVLYRLATEEACSENGLKAVLLLRKTTWWVVGPFGMERVLRFETPASRQPSRAYGNTYFNNWTRVYGRPSCPMADLSHPNRLGRPEY